MREECKAVREFHLACDVPARDAPNVPTITDAETRLRLRLCNEEPRELMQALVAGDLVEVADGIADTIYVTAGTCVQFGVLPEAGHAVSAAIFLVQAAHEALTKAIRVNNFEELPAAAECMHLVCLGIASAFGIPYRSVFEAVHASNMEKVDPNTGKCLKDAGGKVLKPTQWPDPQPWTPPTERIRALLGK